MAIISAAIASIVAVGTAIGAGAGIGAAVAVAAINVGTVIGVVGLGMSVVGMATGNESLAKIGNYLGMAGGAMGIVGGLAGGAAGAMKNLSTAWDDGVGSLFSSTKPVGQVPLGQAGQNAATSAAPQKPYTGEVGATPQPDMAVAASPGSPADKFTGVSDFKAAHQLNPGQQPSGLSQTITPGDMSQFAPKGPIGPTGAPSATTDLANVTAAAKGSPVLGQPAMGLDSWPNYAPTTPPPGKGLFADLPDWAKAQMAISGAQGLSGMLGGWFESATAEEKLALERQAQEWRMKHEDKNQSFTQKNASYAPLVQFGGSGMINRGA